MLYPEIKPYHTEYLDVPGEHSLYVEACGNQEGIPAVFLHGGPGGGISERHRRLFDPKRYNIILFDQRGSGKSKPHAGLKNNTTWDLVSDMELIRERFGINQWLVFGGSWGSTLSLAYAETHPNRVSGLILRGIFLCRPEEIQWFYQAGCHQLFPDLWEHYVAVIPEAERHDFVTAFYKRLTDPDKNVQLAAAKAWSVWEGSTCKLIPNQSVIDDFEEADKAIAMARIECHYFMNQSFFHHPNQLLKDAHKIRHIPTQIVHGRYDVICPVKNAWDLKQALPDAHLNIVPDAGHAFDEPGILKALVTATNRFAATGKF